MISFVLPGSAVRRDILALPVLRHDLKPDPATGAQNVGLPRFNGRPYLGKPRFGGYVDVTPDMVSDAFFNEHKQSPKAMFFAPGRLSLLGAHTAAEGGYTLATGVNKGIYFAVGPRPDRMVKLETVNNQPVQRWIFLYPDNFPETMVMRGNWMDFAESAVRTVKRELETHGGSLPAMNIMMGGSLPEKSGMGSSTALVAGLLASMFGMAGVAFNTPEEKLRLAELVRETERRVTDPSEDAANGVASAINAVAAKADSMLLMRADAAGAASFMDRQAFRLPEEKAFLLVNVDRSLALRVGGEQSPLAERSRDCRQVFEALKPLPEFANRKTLADIKPSELKAHRQMLIDGQGLQRFRRALHIVTESERTRHGARLLRAGQYKAFGRLMNASYLSSRNLFNITNSELAVAHHLITNLPGVDGAQLSDGGSGNTLLVLLDKSAVDVVKTKLIERFKRVFRNLEPLVLEVRPGEDGARQLWRKPDDPPPPPPAGTDPDGDSGPPSGMPGDTDGSAAGLPGTQAADMQSAESGHFLLMSEPVRALIDRQGHLESTD